MIDRRVSPHNYLEFELMTQAGKPLAYFVDSDRLEDFRAAGFVIESYIRNGQRFLVRRPQDDHLTRMWLRTYSMFDRGLISNRTAHVRVGRLLGYTKQQIRWFMASPRHGLF